MIGPRPNESLLRSYASYWAAWVAVDPCTRLCLANSPLCRTLCYWVESGMAAFGLK
jgi:hypothetical protein